MWTLALRGYALRGQCVIYFTLSHTYLIKTENAPHSRKTPSSSWEMRKLLLTVRKSECVILTDDFNCQLRRNVPGCTDKWWTRKTDPGPNERKRPFTVGILFKSKTKTWDGKLRACNDTYKSKQTWKRSRKLDYLCLKQVEITCAKCRSSVDVIDPQV